jgi:hypothetical protein
MSQVDAFNDNVAGVAAARPPVTIAVTRPPDRADDPAATEHRAKAIKTKVIKTPAPGGTADSRWPQWPNAWPDGSRQSRSRRTGQ